MSYDEVISPDELRQALVDALRLSAGRVGRDSRRAESRADHRVDLRP